MKVRLYACGGSAVNIAHAYSAGQDIGEDEATAGLDIAYIDTSKSNLRTNIASDKIYLVSDLDGSGKLRSSNYAKLQECSKEILHQHRPADLNIVLHSGGGGKLFA